MPKPELTICVPFRAGDPDREAAWRWCRARWAATCPDAQIIEADAGGSDFSRSASLNEAAARADGDVLILTDADVFVGPGQVEVAAHMAAEPGLVIGFTRYIALTKAASQKVIANPDVTSWPPLTAHDVEGMPTYSLGGFNAVGRATWDAAGGFDPRFRGWGFEDVAFACAVRALTGAADRRAPGELLHLWHPNLCDPGSVSYKRNFALEQRYEHADAEGTKALIAEWRVDGTDPA